MTMLSIVIPAYNEEDGILDIMTRVLAVRPALKDAGVDEMELIVVDDGSKDRTAELVLAQPDVKLVQHKNNGGYGAALKTGFAAAQGEWIGFLDADGTYPPEYFPKLYAAGVQQGADIVIGSRMAGEKSEMPKVRRLGNLIFARLVNIISASNITDSASGMRIFKRDVLAKLYPLPDGLNLTPVMSTRALHEQVKMVEVAIPYSERVGRSKLSVVRDGYRFGQSIVWTALSYNPARLLGIIGLASLVIAAIVAVVVVIARLQGVTSISSIGAWALFAALVLAVAGVSVLTLGVSFNYFVALFHKTPVRQGFFGRPIFPGLEQHFGWFGLASLVLGVIVAVASFLFALSGGTVSQLWVYYLASASFALIGIQLMIAWVQMQVFDSLRIRDELAADDLRGKETMAEPRLSAGHDFKADSLQVRVP
ncbi:MAG: glycosyltransferase [Anaerolineales bacterium]|nr:glycosyltransferase [Anaerolineales bacterium]